MKRLSKEKFIKGNWGEQATAIRIKNGEFYWLGDVEEWTEPIEDNKEALRIFMPYKSPVLLNRHCVMEGELSVVYADAYEGIPMTYAYETKEERKHFSSVYECLLSFIQPYTRNGEQDEDDYDIFAFTKKEFENFFDALRDGDYIIILLEENTDYMTLVNELDAIDSITDKLGEQFYDCFMEYDNTTYEIGKNLRCELNLCETSEEVKRISNTMEAICGYNLESVIETIKKRDSENYLWESVC